LLLNNVLLLVAMATILVGTLYPLFLDALNAGKISVGAPYFNAVFVPLMLPLLLFIGVGPFLRWKKATMKEVFRKLIKIVVVGLIIGAVLPFMVAGKTSILVVIGISLGGWSIASAIYYLFRNAFRSESGVNILQHLKKIPRATYGMSLAHFGIGIFVFGVTFVSAFQQEKELPMQKGQKVEMAGYEFELDGVKDVQGPNYSSKQASVNVYKDEKLIATLLPEKRTYLVQQSPMTEAGIDTGFLRDVYVALGEQINDNAWGMRLYYKPFIQWVWMGAVFMALGGLLAALDRRYRLKLKREKKAIEIPSQKQQAAVASS